MSEFFSLGRSWCFLRLDIFIFLLGLFQVFSEFQVRVWGVSCLIGLGSLVPAFFFFLVLRTPPVQCWAGGGPFCLFVFFRPADPSHSVLGHGLGNRAAMLEHGTGFFVVASSFFRRRRHL